MTKQASGPPEPTGLLIFSSLSCPYPLSTIILFTFLLVLELASAVAQGVKAQAAFQITYPTLLKAATGQMCLLPLKLLACAALADWSPSAITCQANKNTQEDTTDHTTSSC